MNKVVLALVVIAAGVAAGWYALKGKMPTVNLLNGTNKLGMPALGTPVPGVTEAVVITDEAEVSITYTDNGFAPNQTTVKAGTKVRFTNDSLGSMWVASDIHPTHQVLPGFDQLRMVEKGGLYEYTFVKVGTWRFHNHVNPAQVGTVIVTE